MALFNYECDEVKRKIQEVSPNYPQLITYESEWLYFHEQHYNPGTPVELEYETVSVNPTGSVSNAIPYQYKSASLKGNTKYRDIDTGDILDTFDETKNLDLVSVQMPVLKTTGKNLISDEVFKNAVGNNCEILSSGSFRLKNSTPYIVNKSLNLGLNTSKKIVVSYKATANNNSLSLKQGNDGNIWLYIGGNGDFTISELQIEYSETPTSYEPYQSNILTTPQDLELRGIGDVRDTLDLMTGEFTQRIGEMIVDDFTGWWMAANADGSLRTGKNFTKIKSSSKLSCDLLPTIVFNSGVGGQKGITIHEHQIIIYTDHTNKEELKRWVQQNPLTIQYELATESIKTVALTPLNKPYEGTNHYHIEANIPCEAILEVPVVSTGKQTLVEINN